MKKLSVHFKPSWLVFLGLLVSLGIATKLAIAISAFSPGDQPIGYVAQDEMTNYNLKSGNEYLFRGNYEREFWSGSVLAYPADDKGNVDTAAAAWDSADVVDEQNFDTGRFIATMKDNGAGVAFRLTNLSAAQQAQLESIVVANREPLLNFIRGDRSNEGSLFRLRKHVSGDVVHSRPFYVRDAVNPTLFYGGNDGMLHAINASTPGEAPLGDGNGGQERWAYVPSMLIPKLKKLSLEPYVHDYYVDGQINIATILSGTKRVLVGGLGAGGKGLFALNITGSSGLAASSEADVAGKVMWEVAPTSVNHVAPVATNAYVNLGYTFGTISMAKVGGVDAVILGNGYNDGVGSYATCSHATPNYTNCGGDYAAYLYVINANTGQLIKKIKAGASGTAISPNGLSTPSAIDTNGDGSVDIAYAGDLNGTMWKINLTTDVATALLVTSPTQAITSTPGVAIHPEGGYMVTFGTGKMLVAADAVDTSVHYAYGIWDGAPVANDTLLSQTLSERSFTQGATTVRVRNSETNNLPVWTSGTGNHKGWRVALPAGERVLGEGSFIENGRFYFTAHNPTIATTVPSTTTIVKGENWLMELDYLTGGSKNQPFLDLSGDVKLNNDDRLKYTATDTLPTTVPPTAIGDPILTNKGIALGKWISIGVLSQPILVQLRTLNDTLFNQNPDVVIPPVVLGQGVDGGHFDQDIFYGSGTAGTAPTATITVGTSGQTSGFPATLGAIKVNSTIVVAPLVQTDLPNGTATTTNAETIRTRFTNGFSASRSGNVITVTGPVGASLNGATLTIDDGTSQALVTQVLSPPVAPTAGSLVITGVDEERTVSITCGSSFVGSSGTFTSSSSGTASTRLNSLFNTINNKTNAGYTISCTRVPNTSSPLSLSCTVTAPTGPSACSGGFTVDRNIDVTTNIGPQGGSSGGTVVTPQSGWTNFKPALTTTAFSGGVDATVSGNTCTGGIFNFCTYRNHIHQYDDKYDVTGVNFLNASNAAQNLVNMIPGQNTQFKVLAMNQYLNPAVKLHIGNAGYLFNVDVGYISIKNFLTSNTLDVASLPTYVRAATATAPVIPIGSFAINMPVDALTAKNWWGTGDIRVGMHPTKYSCVWASAGSRDGNMYQPVIPPVNGVDGPGARGWSTTAPTTTPATATGARHNGALTFQLIRANTPNSAIEQNVPGRPEYGWRVKSGDFSTYVLGEYSTYWHHPNNFCYHDTGWTKQPGPDNGSSTPSAKASGSTDPKVGELGVGAGAIVNITTTTVGDVTTTVLTYSSGLKATIVRTAGRTNGNLDGSVTIVTTDTAGNVTTQIVASAEGGVRAGGDERGLQARTGRISWRELVAP